MPDAISNTSPLLYLYRIEALIWLDALFGEVWMPNAVAYELAEGRRQDYNVPDPDTYHWLRRMEPRALPCTVPWGYSPRRAMTTHAEFLHKFIPSCGIIARAFFT